MTVATRATLSFRDTAEDWYASIHSYAARARLRRAQSDMVMAAFSMGVDRLLVRFYEPDLGCLVFPAGGLSTDQRIDALLTYPITVLGCTPSYALFLAEHAAKKGIDLAKQTKVRLTWHTGEPGASMPATRAKIEAAFGAKAFDLPLDRDRGVGLRCDARSGLVHVHEATATRRARRGGGARAARRTRRLVFPASTGRRCRSSATHPRTSSR